MKEELKLLNDILIQETSAKNSWGKSELKVLILESFLSNDAKQIIELKDLLIKETSAKNSWGKNELKVLILECIINFMYTKM